jgi:hypothetical protein
MGNEQSAACGRNGLHSRAKAEFVCPDRFLRDPEVAADLCSRVDFKAAVSGHSYSGFARGPVLITYSAEDFCDASGTETGVCPGGCGAGVGNVSTVSYADSLTVKTEQGKVTGKTINDGKVKAFLGLPYAAPPVGDLRWKAPEPAAKWKGERDATKVWRPLRAEPRV